MSFGSSEENGLSRGVILVDCFYIGDCPRILSVWRLKGVILGRSGDCGGLMAKCGDSGGHFGQVKRLRRVILRTCGK